MRRWSLLPSADTPTRFRYSKSLEVSVSSAVVWSQSTDAFREIKSSTYREIAGTGIHSIYISFLPLGTRILFASEIPLASCFRLFISDRYYIYVLPNSRTVRCSRGAPMSVHRVIMEVVPVEVETPYLVYLRFRVVIQNGILKWLAKSDCRQLFQYLVPLSIFEIMQKNELAGTLRTLTGRQRI